ncbi:MAG: hypothetical protein LW700_06395 [Gemmataceae bacterium]|nr:hypothetical protein [Gemmataceae bacterium]
MRQGKPIRGAFRFKPEKIRGQPPPKKRGQKKKAAVQQLEKIRQTPAMNSAIKKIVAPGQDHPMAQPDHRGQYYPCGKGHRKLPVGSSLGNLAIILWKNQPIFAKQPGLPPGCFVHKAFFWQFENYSGAIRTRVTPGILEQAWANSIWREGFEPPWITNTPPSNWYRIRPKPGCRRTNSRICASAGIGVGCTAGLNLGLS